MSPLVTVIVPYYNQPGMLNEQLRAWHSYDIETLLNFEFIIVDDGSKERVIDTMGQDALAWCHARRNIKIFRIPVDIPWNRGEARNIGWAEARTDWIMQLDTDHVLHATQAAHLIDWMKKDKDFQPVHYKGTKLVWDNSPWYRFRRFRMGAADHTRQKDAIPREAGFGEIKPHIDSYLCHKYLYQLAGGYNLAFSGCLGGGSAFLEQMTAITQPWLAPSTIDLKVYTTNMIPDASAALDRTPGEYKRRKAQLQGKLKGTCEIRNEYERLL